MVGKIIGAAIVFFTLWSALAQIMPDVFQIRGHARLKAFLWGPNTKWIAAIVVSFILAAYIWTVEDRFNSMSAGTVSSVSGSDETGLRINSWGPLPDGSGCNATIDASRLPIAFKDKYDVVLICGFVDPTVDKLKDTRISVSQPFTAQEAIVISITFAKIMEDALTADQEATVAKTVAKMQPRPPKGTPVGVLNFIWFKVALLPKGFDRSTIQKLADIQPNGGKLSSAEASVGITRTIPTP